MENNPNVKLLLGKELETVKNMFPNYTVRIIKTKQCVTSEYCPTRLNVVIGTNNLITRAWIS